MSKYTQGAFVTLLAVILGVAIGYWVVPAPASEATVVQAAFLTYDTPVLWQAHYWDSGEKDYVPIGKPEIVPLWQVNNQVDECLQLDVRLDWISEFAAIAMSDPVARDAMIRHGITEEQIAFVEGKLEY